MSFWAVIDVDCSEIKNTYSMRDIVERYGFHPNRAGFISCPFHQGDRTPSLKVYEKDYHCHACGANGDIFTFVQEIEGVSFKEAFLSLGGTYRPCSRIASQMRREQIKREREEQREAERERTAWKWSRLGEVCRTLRMLDRLIPGMEPYSEVWEAAVSLRERNRYYYEILAFGTKQEQEEMRNRDG